MGVPAGDEEAAGGRDEDALTLAARASPEQAARCEVGARAAAAIPELRALPAPTPHTAQEPIGPAETSRRPTRGVRREAFDSCTAARVEYMITGSLLLADLESCRRGRTLSPRRPPVVTNPSGCATVATATQQASTSPSNTRVGRNKAGTKIRICRRELSETEMRGLFVILFLPCDPCTPPLIHHRRLRQQ